MTGHVQTQLGETATNQNWPLVWKKKEAIMLLLLLLLLLLLTYHLSAEGGAIKIKLGVKI